MSFHERLLGYDLDVDVIYTLDDDEIIFQIQHFEPYTDGDVSYTCVRGAFLGYSKYQGEAHVDISDLDNAKFPILYDCDRLMKTPR